MDQELTEQVVPRARTAPPNVTVSQSRQVSMPVKPAPGMVAPRAVQMRMPVRAASAAQKPPVASEALPKTAPPVSKAAPPALQAAPVTPVPGVVKPKATPVKQVAQTQPSKNTKPAAKSVQKTPKKDPAAKASVSTKGTRASSALSPAFNDVITQAAKHVESLSMEQQTPALASPSTPATISIPVEVVHSKLLSPVQADPVLDNPAPQDPPEIASLLTKRSSESISVAPAARVEQDLEGKTSAQMAKERLLSQQMAAAEPISRTRPAATTSNVKPVPVQRPAEKDGLLGTLKHSFLGIVLLYAEMLTAHVGQPILFVIQHARAFAAGMLHLLVPVMLCYGVLLWSPDRKQTLMAQEGVMFFAAWSYAYLSSFFVWTVGYLLVSRMVKALRSDLNRFEQIGRKSGW